MKTQQKPFRPTTMLRRIWAQNMPRRRWHRNGGTAILLANRMTPGLLAHNSAANLSFVLSPDQRRLSGMIPSLGARGIPVWTTRLLHQFDKFQERLFGVGMNADDVDVLDPG